MSLSDESLRKRTTPREKSHSELNSFTQYAVLNSSLTEQDADEVSGMRIASESNNPTEKPTVRTQ
jgi:hypothetical protein